MSGVSPGAAGTALLAALLAVVGCGKEAPPAPAHGPDGKSEAPQLPPSPPSNVQAAPSPVVPGATRTPRAWRELATGHLASAQSAAPATAFDAALEALERGEGATAAAALQDFDERQLLLAAVWLLADADAAEREPADVAPLLKLLNERVPVGGRPVGWNRTVARDLMAWAAKGTTRVMSVDERAAMLRRGRGDEVLAELARHEAEAGRFDAALAIAEQIDDLRRHARATALARIGMAQAEAGRGGEGDKTLERAIDKAQLRPFVEDGGDEAEALAAVVAIMASGNRDQAAGLPHDHPLVVRAMRDLRGLLDRSGTSGDKAAEDAARACWEQARRKLGRGWASWGARLITKAGRRDSTLALALKLAAQTRRDGDERSTELLIEWQGTSMLGGVGRETARALVDSRLKERDKLLRSLSARAQLRPGERLWLAWIHRELGKAGWKKWLGQADMAHPHAQIEVFARLGDEARLKAALGRLRLQGAGGHRSQGAAERLIEAGREALAMELAREGGYLAQLATSLKEDAHVREALATFDGSRAVATPRTLPELARAARRAGAEDRIPALVDQALGQLSRQPQTALRDGSAIAAWAAEQGDYDLARRAIREALDASQASEALFEPADLVRAEARALLAQGDAKGATELLLAGLGLHTRFRGLHAAVLTLVEALAALDGEQALADRAASEACNLVRTERPGFLKAGTERTWDTPYVRALIALTGFATPETKRTLLRGLIDAAAQLPRASLPLAELYAALGEFDKARASEPGRRSAGPLLQAMVRAGEEEAAWALAMQAKSPAEQARRVALMARAVDNPSRTTLAKHLAKLRELARGKLPSPNVPWSSNLDVIDARNEKDALALALAETRLIAGHVDGALDLFSLMLSENNDDKVTLGKALAAWFVAHPEALTAERAERYAKAAASVLTQRLPGTLEAAWLRVYPRAPQSARPAMARALKGHSKLWSAQDGAALEALELGGRTRAGEAGGAARLGRLVEAAKRRAKPIHRDFYPLWVRGIAAATEGLDPDAATEARATALAEARLYDARDAGRVLGQLGAELADQGDLRALPVVLRRADVPREVRRAAAWEWLQAAALSEKAAEGTRAEAIAASVDILPRDPDLARARVAWLRVALMREQQWDAAKAVGDALDAAPKR